MKAVHIVAPVTLQDVRAERRRQERQWGGRDHDDRHDATVWLTFIEHQLTKGKEEAAKGEHPNDDGEGDIAFEIRDRLVKIAALALAGIDSIDRKEDER